MQHEMYVHLLLDLRVLCNVNGVFIKPINQSIKPLNLKTAATIGTPEETQKS